MYKHRIPAILPLIFPSLLWKVKTKENVIYITFDDGPHPDITPKVLEILNQYNAKATFFCVGENVEKYPETFQLILDANHAVGNHTYNHLKGWKTNTVNFAENINKASKIISSSLFRPPYGRITMEQIKSVSKDYKIIMWSVLTRDYEKNLNINKAIKKLCNQTSQGDIVVFHDSRKAEKNMFILLKQMLEFFSKQGYRFEKLC
ncbi:MAG: polysaccharide deacetylase family protein [Bacteroidia bacterium]|nr:polysaccharide deacetylase family protein [Bacteroidia bacterium]MCZ2140991.1 polysaccharide deacetylase family protein [Bacteroidia bacterium]